MLSVERAAHSKPDGLLEGHDFFGCDSGCEDEDCDEPDTGALRTFSASYRGLLLRSGRSEEPGDKALEQPADALDRPKPAEWPELEPQQADLEPEWTERELERRADGQPWAAELLRHPRAPVAFNSEAWSLLEPKPPTPAVGSRRAPFSGVSAPTPASVSSRGAGAGAGSGSGARGQLAAAAAAQQAPATGSSSRLLTRHQADARGSSEATVDWIGATLNPRARASRCPSAAASAGAGGARGSGAGARSSACATGGAAQRHRSSSVVDVASASRALHRCRGGHPQCSAERSSPDGGTNVAPRRRPQSAGAAGRNSGSVASTSGGGGLQGAQSAVLSGRLTPGRAGPQRELPLPQQAGSHNNRGPGTSEANAAFPAATTAGGLRTVGLDLLPEPPPAEPEPPLPAQLAAQPSPPHGIAAAAQDWRYASPGTWRSPGVPQKAMGGLLSSFMSREDLPDPCAICLDGMCIGQLVARLACGHCFHESCVVGWLSTSLMCPLCKRTLVHRNFAVRPDFRAWT